MKIPKSVTILGRKFKVGVVSQEVLDKTLPKCKGADGAMSFGKRIILIRKTLNKEDQFITYLHECHHAIDYILGFSQITNNELFELGAEGRANGFYDVFKSMVKK